MFIQYGGTRDQRSLYEQEKPLQLICPQSRGGGKGHRRRLSLPRWEIEKTLPGLMKCDFCCNSSVRLIKEPSLPCVNSSV